MQVLQMCSCYECPVCELGFYAFDPFLFLLTLVAGKSLLRLSVMSSGCTWLALVLGNFRGLGSNLPRATLKSLKAGASASCICVKPFTRKEKRERRRAHKMNLLTTESSGGGLCLRSKRCVT